MKPAEVFGIVVRTAGLGSVINGWWWVLQAGIGQAFDSKPHEGATTEALLWGTTWIVGGLVTLRFPGLFVGIAYPREKPTAAPSSANQELSRAA